MTPVLGQYSGIAVSLRTTHAIFIVFIIGIYIMLCFRTAWSLEHGYIYFCSGTAWDIFVHALCIHFWYDYHVLWMVHFDTSAFIFVFLHYLAQKWRAPMISTELVSSPHASLFFSDLVGFFCCSWLWLLLNSFCSRFEFMSNICSRSLYSGEGYTVLDRDLYFWLLYFVKEIL